MNNLNIKSFNIKKEVITAFNSLGYDKLSPVQEKTIPLLLKRENCLVISETGSGKTFSYLIPILNNLDFSTSSIEAIIIVPTIILMEQIKKVFTSFFDKLGYDYELVKTIKDKNSFTKSKPKIVITTPSLYPEIFSHYPTNLLKYVIIDEADMLIFDGFASIIQILKKQIDKNMVSVFSASIKIQDITRVKKALKIKNVISVSSNITSNLVSHYLIDYSPLDRKEALYLLLHNKIKSLKVIVFFKTISEEEEVYSYFKDKKLSIFKVHGKLDKREIKQTISAFENAKYGVLFSSDYTSRGMDIDDVETIISYSVSDNLDYYFHRAGRTGRFDKKGNSYILVNKDDETEIKNIKTLSKRNVTFYVYKLTRNEFKLVSSSYIFKNLGKKDQSNDKLQKQIRHAVNKVKSNKVKPNYKKKVSKAVKRVKEKHRMKVVRTNIAKSGGNVNDFHND